MDSYGQAEIPPINRLNVQISNNNENLPAGVIEHTSEGRDIQDMYRVANPHPATNVQAIRTDVNNISKFLQTRYWPYCTKAGKCEKKTIVHRPDIAVIHEESVIGKPLNSFPYRIPIFFIEIEGEVSGEQEHKALEEAASSLAFIPEQYLLFIYWNRWEFWISKRDPVHGFIDVTSHTIFMQEGGQIQFRAQMQKVTELIVSILVKQLSFGTNIMRLSMSGYRRRGLHAYYDPPVGRGTAVCPQCWVLPTTASASKYCNAHNGNEQFLPQFE